jgi:outer membrane autotransporter protein
MKGATLRYTFDVFVEGNQLIAEVAAAARNQPATVEPRSGILSLAQGANLLLLDQGADLIAGLDAHAVTGICVFADAAGGSSRYSRHGARTELDSYLLLAGAAYGRQFENASHLTLGVFAEYGDGNADFRDRAGGFGSVSGKSDLNYAGGGVLGRYDFAPLGPGHAYVDAALRIGAARNEFTARDLADARGLNASYTSDALYLGGNVGGGYLWDFSDLATLDLYGVYLVSRLEDDDVSLSTGETVSFDAAYSQRVRAGFRLFAGPALISPNWSPYVGAAYEYAFDGGVDASTGGYALPSRNYKGDTGLGEVGVRFQPLETLAVDLGAQGYAGVREGCSGTIRLTYRF